MKITTPKGEYGIELPFNIWTIGAVFSVAFSYSLHESVNWAIVHGILSWIYVVYCAVEYGGFVNLIRLFTGG